MTCQSCEASPTIQLGDKIFRLMLPAETIKAAIGELALRLNADYRDRERPLFLGVLNGAFMFMGELLQRIDFDCEISFVKVASYAGTASTGQVRDALPVPESIRGRHVIFVEDIVDTGGSIDHLLARAAEQAPASVAVATLLFKPDAYRLAHPIDYRALEIPDRFVVGFGLDYDQHGRHLKDLYELA